MVAITLICVYVVGTSCAFWWALLAGTFVITFEATLEVTSARAIMPYRWQ